MESDIPLLTTITTPLIIFGVALVLRAIFAFLETSITAMRLFKIKEMAQTTTLYKNVFQTLEKHPHRILISILIASSLADVTSAALATNIMETVFLRFNLSEGLGFSAGIALASITLILFGEIIPKNFARERGEDYLPRMLWLINILYYLLYPFASVLMRISESFTYTFGKVDPAQAVASEKEIRFLIDYIHDKGLMEPQKSDMLKNIFDLGHTPVREIMVPVTDIVAVAIDTPIQDVLTEFTKHSFTRLPVYKGTIENIVGMIHQKDLFLMLSRNEDKSLEQLIRPIMFIPETIKVNQLLREFREQQMHMAIVLNEHGSIIGLTTLEDVLEEIVGEISDEHELAAEKIIALPQGGYLVEASIPLEELSDFLKISFEKSESITLGGFLTELLQHLPKKGERVLYQGYYFQIQKASPKRVGQVLIFEEKKAD